MSDSHQFPIRIYYEDTDFSGNVYHATYLKFMERGRTELLRDHFISHSVLADEGLAFVVRSLTLTYNRPAHVDDMLEVETSIQTIRGARIEMGQVVTRSREILLRAEVTIALVNHKGAPVRMPPDLLKKLG